MLGPLALQVTDIPGNPNGALCFGWNFPLVLGGLTFENRGQLGLYIYLLLRSQLYKPEVKMIKRLVGHQLIQQNRCRGRAASQCGRNQWVLNRECYENHMFINGGTILVNQDTNPEFSQDTSDHLRFIFFFEGHVWVERSSETVSTEFANLNVSMVFGWLRLQYSNLLHEKNASFHVTSDLKLCWLFDVILFYWLGDEPWKSHFLWGNQGRQLPG